MGLRKNRNDQSERFYLIHADENMKNYMMYLRNVQVLFIKFNLEYMYGNHTIVILRLI